MSILDEAIKEHLELKRQRGAATEEINRLEREAFGEAPPAPPAQPAPKEPEDAPPAPVAEEEPATLPHDALAEPPPEEEEVGEHELPAVRDEPRDEPEWEQQEEGEPELEEDETSLGNFAVGERAVFDPLTDEEDTAPPPVTPPSEPQRDDEPQTEGSSRSEDPPGSEEGKGADGEDLLEETPEFLRESPGDDKLWFEQRPPKDFDFGDD